MRVETDAFGHSERERRFRPIDEVIWTLAERQHGLVTRRQLLDAGVGAGAIDLRLRRHRLHGVHQGVYAAGHRLLTQRGRWLAAVLATAPGSVLSHRAAAALWDIAPATAAEVTCPTERRSRRGMTIHCRSVPDDETTRVDGIPVTTVPRTLLDLAAVLPPDRLRRALHEAEVRRLGDAIGLDVLIARYRHFRGVATMRAALSDLHAGADVLRSELEHRFLAFIEAVGLARPRTNVHVAASGTRYECDCVWTEQRVIVELDGHATHATRRGYERDRARDRQLHARGWTVVRVTWRQLDRAGERDALAADLRLLLERGPADAPRAQPPATSRRKKTR